MTQLYEIPKWRDETAPFKYIDYQSDWYQTHIPGLSSKALETYQPIIDTRIMLTYGMRYISVHPYEYWHQLYNAQLIKLVSQWAPILNNQSLHDGLDITEGDSEGLKAKDVTSEYPNASLDPDTEAYASSADDHVKHSRKTRGSLAATRDITDPDNPYRDPVGAIVDGMSTLFSRLVY